AARGYASVFRNNNIGILGNMRTQRHCLDSGSQPSEIRNMKEKGFTLIELIVVIVILGILAALALPKFIDLRTEAGNAAAAGVAGAVSSATAINFHGRLAGNASAVQINGACTSAAITGLTTGISWGTQYTLTGAATCASAAAGTAISCTVTGPLPLT